MWFESPLSFEMEAQGRTLKKTDSSLMLLLMSYTNHGPDLVLALSDEYPDSDGCYEEKCTL